MKPYVIVTPGYTEKSWGVRTLHQLCHLLNLMEVPAYLVFLNREATNPGWTTPTARRSHIRDGIVIYPEIIPNNFLDAPRVVRWLLNRPGYINGQRIDCGRDDYVMAWSRIVDDTKPILNLQISNEGIFHPHQTPERAGDLFYLGKGNPAARLPDLEQGKTQITREWPANHRDLADLLRRSRMVYSYDALSGINYEATLCGALCVILPNGPYTRTDIAKGELGLNGIAWGTGPEEIDRAWRTLPDAWPRYLETIAREPAAIREFVETTQVRW